MKGWVTLLFNHVRCWQPHPTTVIQSSQGNEVRTRLKHNLSRILRGWTNDLCKPCLSLHFLPIYCQGLPLSVFVTKLISVIDLTHSLFTNSKVTKLTLCQINNRFTHAVNTVHSKKKKKKPKVRCNLIKRAADLSTANIPELLLGRLMVDTGS